MSPQETRRLYWTDPSLLTFEARVVAHGQDGERRSVALEETAFYPESGGQMADHGALGGARVVDVQLGAGGVIWHTLEGELPPVGEPVTGSIEPRRRWRHRAEHTAQHLLSAALLELAGAETRSSRLGETQCTVDVASAELSTELLDAVSERVNQLIEEDLPVRQWFPSPEELARLPLRREAKVTGRVRVVALGDYDVSPCGGTHCTHTAQAGLVQIQGVERYKGGSRIGFAAGAPARRLLAAESRVLHRLGRALSTPPEEAWLGVERLEHQLHELRERYGALQLSYAEREAERLLARARAAGQSTIIASVEGAGPELLRALGARLTAAPGVLALLAAPSPEGCAALVTRSADVDFDCGAYLKRLSAQLGGRGGGRPERAEGRLPPGTDWEQVARGVTP